MPTLNLLSEDNALVVDGIGAIAQYDCYIEMQREKGILHFVKDYKTAKLDQLLQSGAPDRKQRIARLVADINELNSKCLSKSQQCH